MILVLDDEVDPEYRYLGPEIVKHLPETEYHVYTEDPYPEPPAEYDGIVISGSTASVYDDSHSNWLRPQQTLIRRCIDEEVPLLGICFGHQLVNDVLGGTVEHDRRRSTFVDMDIEHDDRVLEGVQPTVPVIHADIVTELGTDMQATARTSYNDYFCSRHVEAPVWTVQFHPEFTDETDRQPSDWSDGDRSFAESNATRVLGNFSRFCERRN